MTPTHPARYRPLLNAKGFCGFCLVSKVINQGLEDVHLDTPYRNTCNPIYRHSCLQAYRLTYNNQRMELKTRLKAARRHAKITQEQLADKIGIKQASISELETGKSGSTSFIAEIARACGVNPIWLATGEGEMHEDRSMSNTGPTLQPHKDAKEYPLISWIAAGSWQEACDNFSPGDAEEWIDSHANAGPHGYWLEVKGLSMVAAGDTVSFPPKMRILVRPEGFDLVSGKFYVARLGDTGETTFKQYIRDAGVEYLQPLNPSYKTMEMGPGVQIIGRVVDAKLPKTLF